MARQSDLSPAQERARQVFIALRGLRNWKNGEVALRCGVTRAKIESKSRGASAIDLEDLEVLARGFRVAEHVFLMTPAAARLWAAQHSPDPDAPVELEATGTDSEEPGSSTKWYKGGEHRHLTLVGQAS